MNTEHVRLKNLTVDYVHIVRIKNFSVIFSLHNSHLPQYIFLQFSRLHLKHLFRRLDYQNRERRRLNPHLFSKRDSSSINSNRTVGSIQYRRLKRITGLPPPPPHVSSCNMYNQPIKSTFDIKLRKSISWAPDRQIYSITP